MFLSPEESVVRRPKLGLVGNLLVRYKETDDGEIPVLFRPRFNEPTRKPFTCCVVQSLEPDSETAVRRKRRRGVTLDCPPLVKRSRGPRWSLSRAVITPTKASSGGEPAQPEEEAVNPDLVNAIRDLDERLLGYERDVRERETRRVEESVKVASCQMGNFLLREFYDVLREELSGDSLAKEILMNICLSDSGRPNKRCLRSNEELLLRQLKASESRLERFKEIAELSKSRWKWLLQMLEGVPNQD